MASPTAFTALYERDTESDAWLVHIEGIDGCHTYGRTRTEAEARMHEALALWLGRDAGAYTFTLKESADADVLERGTPNLANSDDD